MKRSNTVLKRKRFGKFIFWMRDRDFYSFLEVFVDKGYTLLKDFLPEKNGVILDLGAGIGDYTLLSSLKVGKEGRKSC